MKKKVKKATKEIKKLKEVPPLNPADDAFNFGGLPQRDLKKNLGCG